MVSFGSSFLPPNNLDMKPPLDLGFSSAGVVAGVVTGTSKGDVVPGVVAGVDVALDGPGAANCAMFKPGIGRAGGAEKIDRQVSLNTEENWLHSTFNTCTLVIRKLHVLTLCFFFKL